jgi:hypothetical protein
VPGGIGGVVAGPLEVGEVGGVGQALGDVESQGVGAAAIDAQIDDQALEALGALLAEDRVHCPVELGQLGGVGGVIARVPAEAGDPQIALPAGKVGVGDPSVGEDLEVPGVLEVAFHDELLALAVEFPGGQSGSTIALKTP